MFEKIHLGVSNPELIGRKISQYYNYYRSKKDFNPDGLNFMEQDWDNLIILDACRYDVFKSINDIPGKLRRVESRGSATPEFLRGNFHGQEFLDTVYVTTNPMLYRHRDEIDVSFHDIVNLWADDTWNEEYGTVLPKDVTERSKRIANKYPNKRLLVHYMQPHYPFIESDTTFDKGHISGSSTDGLTTWMQVLTGEIDIDKNELWKSYTDNLEIVLPHVNDLVQELTGKTVITSDHGNMFGERASPIPIREWGHPPGIWTDELVKVPWLEINSNERRDILSEEETDASTSEETDIVSQRLESLGYM